MRLNKIGRDAHASARNNGFHPDGETEQEIIQNGCNNLHNEVSELNEAWRRNRLHKPCDKANKMRKLGMRALLCSEEELADIVIYAAGIAYNLGLDLESSVLTKMQYNASRTHRNGGKKA